jgi:hypothetical protein
VLSNSYRLSSFFSKSNTKRGGHRNFLESLIKGLFNTSAKPARRAVNRPSMGGASIKTTPYGSKPIRINNKLKLYITYIAARRKKRPLDKIDSNIARHGPEIKLGCEVCQIPLYKLQIC